MKNVPCIVTFAHPRYYNAATRLARSLNHFDPRIDFFGYTTEKELLGCPLHSNTPYAFKMYAIKAALDKGYSKVLWLDSSMYLIRDLSMIWDELESFGYCLQSAGTANLKDWINDDALKTFGVPRWAVDGVTMYAGAMMGFDMMNDKAKMLFELMKTNIECFKGGWKDHRHDQSIGSLIAFMKGMKFCPWNRFIQFDVDKEPLHQDITFYCKGI